MQKATKQNKHILRNVLLIILAVLILAAGITAYIFRDYLKQVSSLYKGLTHSSEEISSMQAENDKKTNELLNELAVSTMRDLTDEERKLLKSGQLSQSDAISLIQGLMPPLDITAEVTKTSEPASEASTEDITSTVRDTETTEVIDSSSVSATTDATTSVTTSVTTTTKAPEPLDPESEAALRNRISEIIAEIYLLRATYLNEIDDLIADTKQEYIKLPKEQKNLKGKMRLIEKYLVPKGDALETECDASMKTLLTELKGILVKLNLSTSIINEIETAYKEQKELKMAELYSQYSSKLN